MDWYLRRGSLLRIAGVATAFGVFSALQAYNYVSLFTEREQPFHVLLALNVTYWYAWAVLVPGMLWMARRFPFGRGIWVRSAVMHAIGVIVFTSVHAVLTISARVVIMQLLMARSVSWWDGFRELFFLNFDWEMMTYWAVIGLSNALDFYRESQERALAAAQLQTRLAEAQLQALQRQLHPHFLFNTLHTISALMHRNIEAADEMLARLSDLLRLTLDQVGLQEVPLRDELDFLRKYLDIEQTRYGDRLTVHIDVEPVTLDAAVPNFVLQPLVENALRHGIAHKPGPGRIEIVARRDDGRLRMTVRDDGVGMTADTLDACNTGVGLSNTRTRLEHLYAGRHVFRVASHPGQGVEVTIEIPFTVIGEAAEADMESVA